MGQGGRACIVNNTSFSWRVTSQHSYQMESWPFSEGDIIGPNSAWSGYIEFREHIFDTWDDDAAEAYFAADNGKTFTFICRYTDLKFAPGWDGLNFKSGEWISLGWSHDGTVTMELRAIDDQIWLLKSNDLATDATPLSNDDARTRAKQLMDDVKALTAK
jgi:hypothetical protein